MKNLTSNRLYTYYRGGALVLIGILASVSLNAQTLYSLGNDTAYIHQLERETSRQENDSLIASTFYRIAGLYKRIGEMVTAQKYLNRGIKLSRNYRFLTAASYYHKAMTLYNGSDVQQLEKDLLKADSVLRPFTYPEGFKLRAVIWNTLGTIQQIKGDEKGAMDAFTNKAAPLAAESGDALIQGKANKSIAIILMNTNQRTKAAPYLNKAIGYAETVESSPMQTAELVETYVITAENCVFNQQYDSAKLLLDKAHAIIKPFPKSNLFLIYYFAEGNYFDKVQRYNEANQSFEKGLMLAQSLRADHSVNRLHYAKYNTLSHQKEYGKAAAELVRLVESPIAFTADKKKCYKELYQTYSKLNNDEEALRWATRYIVLSDSLYENDVQKDIIELEEKYEDAENQRQIAALNADKERVNLEAKNTKLVSWLLGTVSLTLLVGVLSGTVLIRNRRKLTEQKELQYEQQLREAKQKQQIQVTKALMEGEETERSRLALDLHDGLGSRLAGVKISLSQLTTSSAAINHELSKIIEQLDVSSNELRHIARNMMPEALLRLGLEPALKDLCDSLSSEKTVVDFQAIGIQSNIAQDVQVNIYRIVQELLVNAVRHANASQILVQCSQNEQIFFITIEDNGRGFKNSETVPGKGIGLNNIRRRVEYLKGKLDINSSPDEGTTINIEFDVTQ